MRDMPFEINSIADLARISGWKDGYAEGYKEGVKEGKKKSLRETLETCMTLRFPRITQVTIDRILSITDANVLDSIFEVACTAESLEDFQRDIRGLAPVDQTNKVN